MSQRGDEPIEVLREIWSARGQTSEDLDEAFGASRSCKRMADVGFADLADAEQDLRAAWRAKLKREGKLSPGATSVADLVLGTVDGRD
jgi:hypothetical protein